MQLDKVYEPQRFEPHWAQWWVESNIYQAKFESGKPVASPFFHW
jgi:valyl-tRNA synthetase